MRSVATDYGPVTGDVVVDAGGAAPRPTTDSLIFGAAPWVVVEADRGDAYHARHHLLMGLPTGRVDDRAVVPHEVLARYADDSRAATLAAAAAIS